MNGEALTEGNNLRCILRQAQQPPEENKSSSVEPRSGFNIKFKQFLIIYALFLLPNVNNYFYVTYNEYGRMILNYHPISASKYFHLIITNKDCNRKFAAIFVVHKVSIIRFIAANIIV